jgi:F0F1-type ATP synthase epsilon subunit
MKENNEFFKFIIQNPTQIIEHEVLRVVIETNEGQVEFLPNHINLASFLIFGNCKVFFPNEEINYRIFKGSIHFNSEENSLFLYCIDFSTNTDYKFEFENIIETLKNEIESGKDSEYKLKYLDDSRISLEKIFDRK